MKVVGTGEILHPLSQSVEKIEMVQNVLLTQEASRLLLAALPRLQSLLEQALKGPTKPRSVQ